MTRLLILNIALALLFAACKTSGPASTSASKQHPPKPYAVQSCYKASLDGKTYVIGLFEDSTYVLSTDLGTRLSFGSYHQAGNDLVFRSFIQSFDAIPVVVKASYNNDLVAPQIKLSLVNGMTFTGAWSLGRFAELLINNKETYTIPTAEDRFNSDSMYTIHCAKGVPLTEIALKDASGKQAFRYAVEDQKNNYFECYFLNFKKDKFQILNPKEARLSTQTMKIAAHIVDRGLTDKSKTLQFEEVQNIRLKAGLSSTAEGAALSAYKHASNAGRKLLLK